jgi:hypothetical protein
VLENADLLGAIVLDDTVALWPEAKKAVEEELKPTPLPSARNATPAPTPTPSGLLNPAKRDMLIVALDYNKQNNALVRAGSIYGLLARPYFDAAAQATMLMDRILRNQNVPREVTLNAPLVRAGGLEKYESIVNEVESWFAIPGAGD